MKPTSPLMKTLRCCLGLRGWPTSCRNADTLKNTAVVSWSLEAILRPGAAISQNLALLILFGAGQISWALRSLCRAPIAQRLDQQGEGLRRLAAAWVIEVVS
jgi:hypothetical protein